MQRTVNVVEDLDGNKIVFIHDIIFKGKRSVEWSDVEVYLKQFVGEAYAIEETEDLIYIGADLPDEYTHSNYTMLLRGTNAKAKANAAQGLPELMEIATQKAHKNNFKEKHKKVLDCYLKGMGVVEISKSLGIAYATVWRHRMLLQQRYIEVTGYQVQ